jgi:hypothetical protein
MKSASLAKPSPDLAIEAFEETGGAQKVGRPEPILSLKGVAG